MVDSALLGAGTADAYRLDGGADDDRVKLDGANTGYSGLLLDGGDGDDVIFGGEGPDRIQGGPGFDVIAAYGGDDLIEGGDESDSLADSNSNALTFHGDVIDGGSGR